MGVVMRSWSLLVCVLVVLSGCGSEVEVSEDNEALLGEGLDSDVETLLGSSRLRDFASSNVPVVGAAVIVAPATSNPQYAAALATHYNEVSPEVALKWEVLRPSPVEYRFGDADALVSLAEASGQSVRGHTLVWEVNLPAWLNDTLGPTGVRDAMLTHIDTVVRRYSGRIAHWDVVNEALTSGGTYRNNVFLRAMGPSYISQAFVAAHAADPTAKLAYNDFAIEFPGAKQDAAFAMVRDLRAAGVPVHEVGIQLHTRPTDWVNGVITTQMLRDTIRRFGSLGVEVYITELDARLDQLSGPDNFRLEVQRQVYWNVAAACYAEPACNGVTTWGFTDLHTWLPAGSKPLPFDSSFVAKPAADGLASGLLGLAAQPVTRTSDTSCFGLSGALFCDALESDSLYGWGQVRQAGGQVASLATGAYRGLRAVRATTPTAPATRRGYVEKRVNGTGTTIWSRARLFVPSTSANDLTMFTMDEPLAPYFGVGVGMDATGRVILRVAGTPATRVLGPTFPRGRWVCAELRIQVADVGGQAELFLDGSRVGLLQNVDTLFASGYGTVKAGIIYAPPAGTPAEVRADEIVVSATRPGCQ